MPAPGPEAGQVPEEAASPAIDVVTNEHLMNQILSLLDVQGVCRASAVCKYWRHLSESPEFWQQVVVCNRRISKDQVIRLAERHPSVRQLVLHDTSLGVLDDHFLRLITRHWQLLEVVEVGKEMVREGSLHLLAQLPALHTLRLDSVTFGPGLPECELAHRGLVEVRMRDCRVGRLALRCPELRSLSLTRSCVSGLRVLGLPALTHLDLSGCVKITDAAVCGALLQLPALASLNLRSLVCVTDDTLQEAAQHLPALQALDISCCTLVTLNGVRGFSGLRRLDMSGCNSFLEAAGALQACSLLERLTLDDCSSLTALTLASPSLTSLSLRGCQSLHTLDLQCISLAELHLSHTGRLPYPTCSALHTVRLRTTTLTALSWHNFPALQELDLDAPALETVELVDCDRLTAASLAALSDRTAVPTSDPAAPPTLVTRTRGCPNLRQLRLESCDGLRALRLHHSALTALVVSRCKGLVSLALHTAALEALALEECAALEALTLQPAAVEHLHLGSCASLAALRLHAPALLSLGLRGCAMVTSLVLDCPALEALDGSFCSSLTDDALTSAVAPRPPLRSLVLSVCGQLGARGLLALAPLSTLTLLDISYTQVDDLAPVYEACPGLRSLSASSCAALLPSCVEALLPAPARPAALPQLQHLDLSYTPLPPTTTTALLHLGTRFQTLALNGCKGVTDAFWEALHTPPPAHAALGPHQLVSLSLVSCQQLRTLCLGLLPPAPIPLVTGRPYLPPRCLLPPGSDALPWGPAPDALAALTSLRVGLAALQVAALRLPRLQLLDLSGCGHLRHLTLHCPALHTVLLQGCGALPAEALGDALAGCSSLEVLDVQHVAGARSLAARLAPAPALRSLLTCTPACTCSACAAATAGDGDAEAEEAAAACQQRGQQHVPQHELGEGQQQQQQGEEGEEQRGSGREEGQAAGGPAPLARLRPRLVAVPGRN